MSYEDQIAKQRQELDGLIRTVAELRGDLQTHQRWSHNRAAAVDQFMNELTAMPPIEATTELASWEPGPARVAVVEAATFFYLEKKINEDIEAFESTGRYIETVQFGPPYDGTYTALIVHRARTQQDGAAT